MSDREYQDEFVNRTNKHIASVNKYAKKIGKAYPNHDNDKLNELFDGYSLMHKKNRTAEEQKQVDKATTEHILNNEHHCEHWSTTSIEGFTRDNPTPHGALEVGKMPKEAIEEMCCDWCAMSEEFGNTPFEWLDKVNGTRWKFTNEQLSLIKVILYRLWEK